MSARRSSRPFWRPHAGSRGAHRGAALDGEIGVRRLAKTVVEPAQLRTTTAMACGLTERSLGRGNFTLESNRWLKIVKNFRENSA
jgi:hypothetical protein